MKAKFIKNCIGFTGNAKLYELSQAIEYGEGEKTKYIIVSATNAMFSRPETYIFPANKNGEVISWGELDGSYQGGLSHETALKNGGFEII